MLLTKTSAKEMRVGAHRLPDGSWEFLLWAPKARSVSLHLLGGGSEQVMMDALERGYHCANIPGLAAASQYFYRIDDARELPDPASRHQPEGVHGPSQVVD